MNRHPKGQEYKTDLWEGGKEKEGNKEDECG
jgi:hypothetical protein